MIDRRRLAQFLGMMGSVGDGEALNAARKAHRLVTDAGLTWQEVLGVADVAAPDYRTPPSKRGSGTARYGRRADQSRPGDRERHTGSDIRDMLSMVSNRKHEVSTLMFIASLSDFWERNGYLTGGQYSALRNICDEKTGGMGERWNY